MCTVFIDIMERPVSDIFSTFVFNNIMEVTFIFSPRVFRAQLNTKRITYLVSVTWRISKFRMKIAKYIYYHQHNGVEGVSLESQSPAPGADKPPFADRLPSNYLPPSHFISPFILYPFPLTFTLPRKYGALPRRTRVEGAIDG